MASARSGAIESTAQVGEAGGVDRDRVGEDDLLHGRAARRRSSAGPQSTACVAAMRRPSRRARGTTRAASVIEPPVEIMSSTMSTLRPSTSPMRCSTAISSAEMRRLSTIARSRVERLGVGARHLDAADVGRDDGEVRRIRASRKCSREHRRGVEVVDGDVEEALDLRGVQVEREHAVGARRARAVFATSLALIGTRPSSLRSLRA